MQDKPKQEISNSKLNTKSAKVRADEGLLIYGSVIIPFIDHFPKDTELYKIMTTKLDEIS